MNAPIEDRVRDLLADRTAGVSAPVGWAERVVSAGRRRRTRRRVGVVTGAAFAIALVVLAATVGLPQPWRHIEPVGPRELDGTPVDPGDLPIGPETQHLRAITKSADDPATIVSGDLSWATKSFVWGLLTAGDGVVALIRWDSERLVYRAANGSQKVLLANASTSGFAVSADGERVAWMDLSTESSGQLGTLELAELPSGKVTVSMPVKLEDLPGKASPTVVGFLGDQVVLTYGEARWPSVWDPGTRRISPLPRGKGQDASGELLTLSERAGVALFLGKDGCVRPLSLAGGPALGWRSCGFDPGAPLQVRISPDGRWLGGFRSEGDTVWVRDLRTGRVVWQQRFKQGIDIDGSFSDRRIVTGLRLSELAWESPDTLLVTYGSPRDLDAELGDLLRCTADRPACERVPTPNGERVTRLGE